MIDREELIILLVGLVAITVITRIIAAKVVKHLSPSIARYTFIFTGALGLYYLVDILIHNSLFYLNIYFYFWLLVITIQIIYYIRSKYMWKND